MSLISFNIYILKNIGNNIKKFRDVNKISKERLAKMICIPKRRMTMIEEGNYINGKKEGTWTFRNSTGNYTNGKKDGTWTFLSSDGISEEAVYEDGELKYININD